MPQHQRNIIVLSTTIFLAAFSWNQIVPFLPLFLKELGVDRNLVQWSYGIFVAQALAGMIAQPFWGKIGDTVGRKPMVIRAGLCLTGIYLGMSFCNAPWQLAALRFLNGALTGFIPGSLALIATNTPKELAPKYVATAQTMTAAGVILGPAIGWMAAAAIGFRASMRVSGAAVLLSTLLVVLFVRESSKTGPAEKTSLLQDFLMAVRSRTLASVMFAVLLMYAFASAVYPVLAVHLGTLDGNSPHWFPGVVFSLPAVAMVLSVHRWNRMGELWGYNRVIMLGLVGAGIGGGVLTFVHNIWIFAVVYFAAGLLLASVLPSAGALICLRVEESFRGRAYGMQTGAATFGALLAFLGAFWVGSAFSIPAIFLFVGIALVVGAPVFYLIAHKWPEK